MGEDDDLHVFELLADLATGPALSRGDRVLVTETQELFHCAGNTAPAIAAHLGWSQANVWLPEHAKPYMENDHPEISDHLRAIEIVLANPISVSEVPDEPDEMQFFAYASHLRAENVLNSTSIRTVDALIELRSVNGERYLRVFHLSPMRRTQGGRRRWP